MTTPADNSNWSAPVPSGSIDPLVQARLDRLAQRNASPSASAASSRASSSHAPRGAAARSGFPSAPGSTAAAARSGFPPASGAARPGFPPAPGSGSVSPTARTGRRHAAKGSRKAALAISLTATGALSGLFAFMDSGASASAGKVVTTRTTAASRVLTASTPSTIAPAADTTASTAKATASTSSVATGAAAATTVKAATSATTAKTAAATAAATTAAKNASGLTNGTYTGDSIATRWGPVQVAVTIAAGKITDVKAIDVPMDRGKSVQINTRATPILRSEALTAQSSSIANVSGATYTSNGYADSLQSAIDQARSAVTANAA
jgi:uncharacterized protein with FMN-binding domain